MGVALGINLVEVDVTPVSVVVARLLVRASCVDDSSIRGSFRVRARGLRVFPRPSIEEGVGGASGTRASVGELLLAAVDLYRHWHPAVVRDPTACPSRRPLGLRPPILVRACRVLRLIVQRGQVLSVLDHHGRLMISSVAVAPKLLRIHLVALLVLGLLVLRMLLLLLLLLLLLELLLSLGMYLLLYGNVVL